MISEAFRGLDRPETITGYGVKDEQYATAAAALVWTLGQPQADRVLYSKLLNRLVASV